MGGIQNIIKFSDCRDFYVFLLLGIGYVSASILSNELGDMSHFKNERALFSYLGLTPREFSTGSTKRLGSISKKGNSLVRAVLIQVAWRAIKKDPKLMGKFNELASRANKKRAIVAIARKLIGITRSVIINKSAYEVNYCK
jgi:transposase